MLNTIILAVLAGSTAFLGWRLAALRRTKASAMVPCPPWPDLSAELAALELALDDAHAAARLASTERGSFLADISHEIRTPMNAVIGFAELLLESRMEPAQRRHVELIAESGRAMLRLLGDLMDVARIEAGDLRLVSEPTDIREALGHCVDLMRPIAQARGLSLALRTQDNVPDMVMLDRTRLRQVMLNLIGNAVKFTDHGQVEVQVHLTAAAHPEPQVAISVIDTGVGIAPERQASLFRPFARGDAGTSRPASASGGGTGLGLVLTHSLVGAMGGTIGVDSAPGLGTCFTVTLPLTQAECAACPTPPAEVSLKGCRVLVAEDHAINQELMLAMLQVLGIEPVVVPDGLQAIAAIEEACSTGLLFDLVLMDMRMEPVDGLEACQRIREAGHTPAELPIVALSANCLPQDIAACHDAGMQAHLAKPVRIEQLGRTLREVLASAGTRPAPASGHGASALDLLHHAPVDRVQVHRLEGRYRQRKQDLMAQLRRATALTADRAADVDWQAIAAQLHKLAGVAANFGETELGRIAGHLERGLLRERSAAARLGLLSREWPTLERAAG